MLIRVAGAIALSCVCGIAFASYGFEPVAALAPEIVDARSIAVGDVTGDGRDDVVLLGGGSHPYYGNKILVYAQQADGGFSAPVAHAYGDNPSGYQRKLALADLDADGDLDIAVLYERDFQGALVLMRNEDSQFALTTVPVERVSQVLEFMDVDGDGHLDIVTRGGWSWPEEVHVHHGDGDGGIRDRASYPLTTVDFALTDALYLADMDNDGQRDLVYATYDAVIMQRHENGGFSSTARTLLRAQGSGNMTVADFNADGRTDIATVREGWNDSAILIYPQGADGRYRLHRRLHAGRFPVRLLAHDMDGDGRQDLVAPRTLDAMVGVFFGRQGGFQPEVSFLAGGASALAVGDLNHDGLADIALMQGGVSLLMSRSSAMEGDLGVYLGLAPNAAALRVDNHGGLSSQSYTLRLRLSARYGPLSLGEMPEGCFGYNWGEDTTEILCQQLPPLAPGAHRIFAFPFTLPDRNTHDTLIGRAELTSFPDLRQDNNTATKRLLVPPAAGKRKR